MNHVTKLEVTIESETKHDPAELADFLTEAVMRRARMKGTADVVAVEARWGIRGVSSKDLEK